MDVRALKSQNTKQMEEEKQLGAQPRAKHRPFGGLFESFDEDSGKSQRKLFGKFQTEYQIQVQRNLPSMVEISRRPEKP